ncbi:PREDICTED: proline-rich protein 3 [Tarenaya hassleriana]|uniref:proline-rich protein 3 n=1 Tax=Tarenaya hassleriana TaxID=28532 RepID=UPI00053C4468|nr:PREDICTED: proline-rich protein 3 [Tarenaya hassleriana]
MAVRSFSFAASLIVFSSMIIASVADYGNDANPETGTLIPIAVEGMIMCKSGDKTYPIQGAKARITCVKTDDKGKEIAPISILSNPSDAKGYFYASLHPSQLPMGRYVTKCKGFLHSSPVHACDFPTDENKGIRGQSLHSFRFVADKGLKLYWLKPFFFTSEPTFY